MCVCVCVCVLLWWSVCRLARVHEFSVWTVTKQGLPPLFCGTPPPPPEKGSMAEVLHLFWPLRSHSQATTDW